MHALQISLVTRPSHCPFLIASVYLLEAIENWTMGSPGNDANANQVCSNLLPPHTTEQFHKLIASNRYTAIVAGCGDAKVINVINVFNQLLEYTYHFNTGLSPQVGESNELHI